MKYKPKRRLKAAIEATQASVDSKWKLANKGKLLVDEECFLCKFTRLCGNCPLFQFTYKDKSISCCGLAYDKWRRNPTLENFMVMRRKLQATKRWLVKQL